MSTPEPQKKRAFTTDLPGWLIILIIAAGVAGYFLSDFLNDRSNTAMTGGNARPTPYVITCVVGSSDTPRFSVKHNSNRNTFSTGGRNQLAFGEIRDGERIILFTVEAKPGGNGCGVLIITGDQEAFVDWVSDLDHHRPAERRRDPRVHATGTTEWDVPCRVSDD